jgi:hypothetical protein
VLPAPTSGAAQRRLAAMNKPTWHTLWRYCVKYDAFATLFQSRGAPRNKRVGNDNRIDEEI